MLSPPFRPTASSPPRTTPLPALPFEIIRRIIHFRLALTPSYPALIPTSIEDGVDAGVEHTWDGFAGGKAKSAEVARRKERGDVMRAAKGLMGVCKAWKPVVLRYLYAEPHITHNLPSLASAILLGDAKWSDINLHTFSLPGRYITTLDLSLLSTDVLHPISIQRACLGIFPLLPNVKHLKLPSEGLPFPLEEIGWAAFGKQLRCLEGVQVDHEVDGHGRDGLVELLRRLPNLEVLAVYEPASFARQPDTSIPSQSLRLPHLHTLKLENVKSGRLMNALLTAELPALRHLLLTSYFQELDDQTYVLQEMHGEKLLSLAYLPARWPGRATTFIPAAETSRLHPNLVHLAYLLPDNFDQLEVILDSFSSRSSKRRLSSLTISKGYDIPSSTNATFQRNLSSLHRLFQYLCDQSEKGPAVGKVNVDSFKWVKAELGRAAMFAGANGEIRNWSSRLLKKGIELRDMDGALPPREPPVMPSCIQGRRRSSASAGWGMIAALAEKGSSPDSETGREDEDGG